VCLKSVLVFVMMMRSFAAVKLRPKRREFFWGQPPLRLFFRHQHLNPSLLRVSLLRTRTKANAILMANEDESESESNKKRSVVARKQPLLHSFLMRKVIFFSNTDEDDRKTLRKCIQLYAQKIHIIKYYPGRASVGIQDVIRRVQSNRLRE